MRKLTLILLMALMLAGCSTLGAVSDHLADNHAATKVAVQYATLKTIEDSEDITGPAVVAHVERVRGLVKGNAELALTRLVEEVRGPIDWQALSMSDRLLLDSLIAQIEHALADLPERQALNATQRVRVLTLLGWVEQVAAYDR